MKQCPVCHRPFNGWWVCDCGYVFDADDGSTANDSPPGPARASAPPAPAAIAAPQALATSPEPATAAGSIPCPVCGLVSLPGALICDCGYNFDTQLAAGKTAAEARRDLRLHFLRLTGAGLLLLALALVRAALSAPGRLDWLWTALLVLGVTGGVLLLGTRGFWKAVWHSRGHVHWPGASLVVSGLSGWLTNLKRTRGL